MNGQPIEIIRRAVAMWSRGENTWAISKVLKIPEPAIDRWISQYLDAKAGSHG